MFTMPTGYSLEPDCSILNFSTISNFSHEQLNQNDLRNQVIFIYRPCANEPIMWITIDLLSKLGAQMVLVDLDHFKESLDRMASKCYQVAKYANRWHFRNGKWQRVQRTICFTLESFFDKKQINNIIEKVKMEFGKINCFLFSVASGIQTSDSISDSKMMQIFSQKLDEQLITIAKMSQILLPCLEETKGTIINISTVHALQPVCILNNFLFWQLNLCFIRQNPKYLTCSVTQCAIDMLMKCLSLELGPKHIRINSIK